ncbi:MAG TPA: TetR/AcrR family transcriptional regulator [Actinospica sp.]|jgi:AcrR family transcriptional regulator|nr:TetR/AcrR family transcriptional regulator [Actinospica sp.]
MTTARRDAVLEAAVEVFAERGYRGTSFDEVARRAGLTRQGVLHYFPSKTKLLMGILRFREDMHRDHLADGHADLDDLPSLLAEVLAFDHRIPALAQVNSKLMVSGVVHDDPVWQEVQDYYRTLRDYMAERLTGLYGERLPSGLSPRAAATALLAMLDGFQEQWLLDGVQADYPEIMREVISVLLGSTPA